MGEITGTDMTTADSLSNMYIDVFILCNWFVAVVLMTVTFEVALKYNLPFYEKTKQLKSGEGS